MRIRTHLVFVLAVVSLLASATSAGAQSRPDGTYGPGGSKSWSTTEHDEMTVETATIRDKNGTIREQITTTYNKDGSSSEQSEWFDASGKKTRETMDKYDSWHYEEYWREEDYVDGVLDSGDIWEEDPATLREIHRRYKKEAERYEIVPTSDLLEIPGFGKHVILERTLFVAGAFVQEGGGTRFWTRGLDGSCRLPINPALGVIADVQWTTGSLGLATFTKLQILGGVAFSEQTSQRIFINPHVLVGLSRVSADYGALDFKIPASTAVAIAAGVDLGMKFNRQTGLQFRVDYNPTFASGGVQHNIRFDAGLRVHF